MTASDRPTMGHGSGRVNSSAGASLVADLTGAMHAVAHEKREHLVVELTEAAGGQVETAWLRGAGESRQLTLQAERDIDGIYRRARALIQRIRRDSEHEIELRRRRLGHDLSDQVTVLSAEVEAVLSAVDLHRASLDRFFDRLDAATEPSEIVALAADLPDPPDFKTIRDTARSTVRAELQAAEDGAGLLVEPRSEGEPQTDVVGVMDAGRLASGTE